MAWAEGGKGGFRVVVFGVPLQFPLSVHFSLGLINHFLMSERDVSVMAFCFRPRPVRRRQLCVVWALP